MNVIVRRAPCIMLHGALTAVLRMLIDGMVISKCFGTDAIVTVYCLKEMKR